MKIQQLLMRQGGDDFRIAAGIEAVGRVRINFAHQRLGQDLIRRRHGAFHLIIDHPLIGQGRIIRSAFGADDLKPVPLLLETQFGKPGVENRVQIDVQKIVKILAIGRGKGIHGPIGSGQGVHKGAQAPFDHGEKRIPHRIFSGAA